MKDNVLVVDGVIGIILYFEGLDICLEVYNFSYLDKVECIYCLYIEVGVDVI